MNTFNSNNFIKTLKEGYDAIPVPQGNTAAKTLVADSIKITGYNPIDVLSFISGQMALSDTLTEAEWKMVIEAAIKNGGDFGKNLEVFKAALKGKLSSEEMFNLAASCCGENPVLLRQELCLNRVNWLNVVENLIKTPVENVVETPVSIKVTKKNVEKKTVIKVSKTTKIDPRSKSINLIKDGVKKEWFSYRDCEKEIGAGHGTISQLVSGKLKAVKGWVLFKEENSPETAIRHSIKRSVIQMKKDKRGYLRKVNTFSSLTEAAKATRISHSSISKVLTGTYQSAGGYVWKSVEAAA